MNPIQTGNTSAQTTVSSSGGSSASSPAIQSIQNTPQPTQATPGYFAQFGNWVCKSYGEYVIYAPETQKVYKDELTQWLSTDQSPQSGQALDSVINSLAKTLKPLIPPPFDSVEASQGFILLVLHSLAKNSLDQNGKTTLSSMVEKLMITLQPHISRIRAAVNENQGNLETMAPEILTPAIKDVLSLLINPTALLPSYLPVWVQKQIMNKLNDAIVAQLATFENLQRFMAVDKLLTDSTHDETLKTAAPDIQNKIEQAKEPGAKFLKEILSKDDVVGKLITTFLDDKGAHSSKWLQAQLNGLIVGNPQLDLVSGASLGITKIVTKLILTLSKDAEEGKTKECIQQKTVDLLKSAVDWVDANRGAFWDVKNSPTKAGDFKGLADLLWKDLELDGFGALFDLSQSDQNAVTEKLKTELPSLIESLYEATADGYVHELFNEVHRDENAPAIDPQRSQFAKDCAAFTADMLINDYLAKPENSKQFAALAKSAIADHKDFKHFLPLTEEFWTNITSDVVAKNGAIKGGLEKYLEHTIAQMIERLISQLDKASPDVGSTFDQEAKAAVLKILKKHLKGDKTIRTRKESIEGISAMLRELFALGEDEIPIPKDFQELFWEKGLPQLIENMADNFLNAPYMKSKLANFIHDLNKEELGKDEISLPKIENQELHNLSTDLVREAVTFGEVRVIKIFQFLGWFIGMDGTFAQKSAIKLLYGMFGKQVVDNINNWDIKKIIDVSIETANKNQVFTKKDEPPTRNLADEIIHYIDKLGEKLLFPRFTRKGEDLEKWLKSKSADDAIKLKRFIEAFCKLLISPLILLYKLTKFIIETTIKNRINFSLNKAEKEIDLSLVHDALEAVLQKWKEHSNAEAAS